MSGELWAGACNKRRRRQVKVGYGGVWGGMEGVSLFLVGYWGGGWGPFPENFFNNIIFFFKFSLQNDKMEHFCALWGSSCRFKCLQNYGPVKPVLYMICYLSGS